MKSGGNDGGSLILGGPPRADLLPPEVGLAARGRVLRRNAIAVIVLAILVVVAAYAGAAFLAVGAQAQLDAANARTQELLTEQAKYAEVKQVTSMLEKATVAQRVGTSTEIDWKDYLNDIQASLPAGTLVTNVVAETATPVTAFAPPSVPLQGDRIGELRFTATSTSLPDVQKWLDALATLDGFVDASPGSVTLNDQTGTYEVTITMHVNKLALLLRFDEAAAAERDKALAEKEQAAKDAAAEDTAGTDSNESDSSTDGGE
jgi:Tfp pilus assembly protein PilN